MTLDELGSLLDHLPRNGWEFVGLIALLAFAGQAIGGGMILRWHRQRHSESNAYRTEAIEDRQELKAAADAIKGQVVNGHTKPMRADLDRVLADIDELKQSFRALLARQARWDALIPSIEKLPEDVRALRADLAEERNTRRELAADVRADMARHRDDMTNMSKRLRDATG